MTPGFSEDIRKAKAALAGLPRVWDGRQCILEMKEADYHWKQMGWWAFDFEFLCRHRLGRDFQIPGEKFRTVEFDLKGSVNWDLKAKAIKSDEHSCILNDCSAIEASIQTHQEHGVIIALCDVEYNDVNRSFQQWHSEPRVVSPPMSRRADGGPTFRGTARPRPSSHKCSLYGWTRR